VYRVAVMASGSGSNLQAILDRLHHQVAGVEVALVVSDVPGALALERAERADIPTAVFPVHPHVTREERDRAIADAITAASADLIVLAGYMRMLTPPLLERFPWRVINLHPALLPAFPGTDGIRDALEYGVKVTGVTVHFVDEGMDTGPIIRQESLTVGEGEGRVSLGERIHALEHRVLPRVVELFATGKVQPPERGSRLVRVDDSEPSRIDW